MRGGEYTYLPTVPIATHKLCSTELQPRHKNSAPCSHEAVHTIDYITNPSALYRTSPWGGGLGTSLL